MKKDFLTILILLILAVIGMYVSCTGTRTASTVKKRIEKTAFRQIDFALLVTTNDETAVMGCPCRITEGTQKQECSTLQAAL